MFAQAPEKTIFTAHRKPFMVIDKKAAVSVTMRHVKKYATLSHPLPASTHACRVYLAHLPVEPPMFLAQEDERVGIGHGQQGRHEWIKQVFMI